jgi:hypothetical protein
MEKLITTSNATVWKVFINLAHKLTQPADYYPIKFYTKTKLRRSRHLYAIK